MIWLASLCLYGGCLGAMDHLKGHPMTEVVDILGFPDRESEILGRKVYYWGEREDAQCSFKIVADTAGRFDRWGGTGSADGCANYRKRLRSVR